MSPKEYYYNQFADDLKALISGVGLGGDGHFHIIDLFFDNSDRVKDRLAFLVKNNLAYFLAALSFTILIDQTMYAHFKKDYEKFRTMTWYPKVTWSIGWCTNINPWQLFEHRIALSRGLRNPEKTVKFTEFAEFFIGDIKDFFQEQNFEKAKWKAVRKAMIEDSDVSEGEYGKIFIEKLKNL